MDTKMSGTQDPKATRDDDTFKTQEPQPEHVPLECQLDPGKEDLKPNWLETKPAVKPSGLLQPYFTVSSCSSAFPHV